MISSSRCWTAREIEKCMRSCWRLWSRGPSGTITRWMFEKHCCCLFTSIGNTRTRRCLPAWVFWEIGVAWAIQASATACFIEPLAQDGCKARCLRQILNQGSVIDLNHIDQKINAKLNSVTSSTCGFAKSQSSLDIVMIVYLTLQAKWKCEQTR